jgi:hypothetical protein
MNSLSPIKKLKMLKDKNKKKLTLSPYLYTKPYKKEMKTLLKYYSNLELTLTSLIYMEETLFTMLSTLPEVTLTHLLKWKEHFFRIKLTPNLETRTIEHHYTSLSEKSLTLTLLLKLTLLKLSHHSLIYLTPMMLISETASPEQLCTTPLLEDLLSPEGTLLKKELKLMRLIR